jgi:hypothetical protein
MSLLGGFGLLGDVGLGAVVLAGEAPRRVLSLRIGATFGAGLDDDLGAALESARLFKATMSSLFHVLLPDSEVRAARMRCGVDRIILASGKSLA